MKQYIVPVFFYIEGESPEHAREKVNDMLSGTEFDEGEQLGCVTLGNVDEVKEDTENED